MDETVIPVEDSATVKQSNTVTSISSGIHNIIPASNCLTNTCQHTSFHKEVLNLKSKTGKRLPLVRQLCLFLDKSEYIRCGGKIHNDPPVNSYTKFPLWLPKGHPLTRMIVYAMHKEQLHVGVNCNSTVTTLRQRYWIPSARQVVRQLLRRCVPCCKIMGKPYMAPESPPLPQA